MKNGSFVFCIALMMCAMLFSNTFGATAIELDFEGLVDKSDAVLVGYVRAVRSEGERKPIKISTVIEIQLESCFKGSCPPSLVLKQLGGKFQFGDGWYFQNVPGMPQFEFGERVLLCLEKVAQDRWVVTGMNQGKFRVNGSGSQAPLSRSLSGLNLVRLKVGSISRRPKYEMPTRLDVFRTQVMRARPIIDIRPSIVGGTQ